MINIISKLCCCCKRKQEREIEIIYDKIKPIITIDDPVCSV